MLRWFNSFIRSWQLILAIRYFPRFVNSVFLKKITYFDEPCVRSLSLKTLWNIFLVIAVFFPALVNSWIPFFPQASWLCNIRYSGRHELRPGSRRILPSRLVEVAWLVWDQFRQEVFLSTRPGLQPEPVCSIRRRMVKTILFCLLCDSEKKT